MTPLDRGGDTFVSAPHGLISLNGNGTAHIKIANTTNRTILLRSGKLIGRLSKADEALKKINRISEEELNHFILKAAHLATLVSALNATPSINEVKDVELHAGEETQSQGETTWGPKTSDLRPDQIYPSNELRETIDVDLELSSFQREALYRVLEENQTAFGFDRRLGHYKTKVHIELIPGTKPINSAPYPASPVKREAIDKQIDLWLAQDVIEESRSPWGAPVIIVYRNDKPRMCIDYCRMNKAMVADQHPIPNKWISSPPYLEPNIYLFSTCSLASHS